MIDPLKSKTVQHVFNHLYGDSESLLEEQTGRYRRLVDKYLSLFTDNDFHLFSSPGRVELSGNHTDHNHGRVLAASINLDSIAAASRSTGNRIVIHSDGYPEPFTVDLSDLSPQAGEEGKTEALIRGTVASLKESGFQVGGFNACLSSDVKPGSGLSSSASFEVLTGLILSAFYNSGHVPFVEVARAGQFAENRYFGKPSGLMDQVACAAGGIVTIDFNDPRLPVISQIEFDFDKKGYDLLVTDTGKNHEDLTSDYASIPAEMKAVAACLGKQVAREINFDEIVQNIPLLRQKTSDRAVLRVLHFLYENNRVEKQVSALRNDEWDLFLRLVNASGASSLQWLQNGYSLKNPGEQSVPLMLALSEQFIRETGKGACRVHGGGFAGTILAFLPSVSAPDYIKLMERVLGTGCVTRLAIRSAGAIRIT
ncbi:MAG: galactokinase [Spirochaetales bacterium]|nr:galactokinase [Spirochaetales bacterium]